MSLATFETLNATLIKAEPKYVLTALAILADDFGRVKDFNPRQIEELCDLGPRTVAVALDELCKMDFLKFLDKGFIHLKLPKTIAVKGGSNESN